MVSVRLKAVAIFVIASIALSLLVWSLPKFFMPTLTDTEQVETDVFELINEERVSRGLPALLKDDALTSIALQWSEHLAEIGYLTHGDFEGRMSQIGYSQSDCGEIIAMYEGWTSNLGSNS
ncbi:MAG: CAP domain-containing protein [Candidatus Bathyarchaeota archaeon]|nr:CAP domain-containing protein [Candidatus Bathyarchaeota archaeon]